MSQNYLDLAGLTAYDTKIKTWFKSSIDDIMEDPIRALFAIPDNPYVTFTAEEDNSSIGLVKLSTNQTLEYRTDISDWTSMSKYRSIKLNNIGDKVYVRGVLSADNTSANYTQFEMSGKIAASGNCNALWNYNDLTAPLKEYCGFNMFFSCEGLTTAPDLPATTLASFCYSNMFDCCKSLTTAPSILQATTLKSYCYQYMFKDCKSLTQAPELPATTLTFACYYDMFSSCKSLTTAPDLPATTLADYCYSGMFYGCRSLTTAPELPATTLAGLCYKEMFQNCTSLTTAPELPATTLKDECYYGMFKNCKSLTTAPELQATTLAESCYESMFFGCSNLNYIKCLATNISTTNCTTDWVSRVASTGTFIKHPDMNNWTTGTKGIPEGWKVENAEL